MAEEVVLMKGNEAIAHAAIRCGADGYFGYPITPQSEVLETLAELKPWETTGMVVLQAESEVAAINMLMTASRSVVREVNSVFTFIEKPYSPVHFKELLVSPNEMKLRFIRLINDEIKNRQSGRPAYIRVKVNHITDSAIVKKLYEASAAGVPVDMLVRGNCSLVTGIPGISDTIHISGIIDRYLEHSRIFIFAAGGENKTFIGSADWMPRNLDNRIEVIAPVYDARIKEDLWKVIDFGLRDTCQGSVVDGTGENRPWMGEDGSGVPFRSQEELYKYYLAVNEL